MARSNSPRKTIRGLGQGLYPSGHLEKERNSWGREGCDDSSDAMADRTQDQRVDLPTRDERGGCGRFPPQSQARRAVTHRHQRLTEAPALVRDQGE